jgi:2-octaprenyl-6-methoxyphenol hydroxylase
LKPGSLDFVPGADDGYLGQMFENRFLRRALYEAAQASDAIQLHMPTGIVAKTRDSSGVTVKLDNGTSISSYLMIVAEGRQSITREEAGIKIIHWQYNHSAMVGAIFHEKPHNMPPDI